eukprot:jgi/Bigna1/88842/estExt_fgenesh1_pg.C_390042
MDRVLKKRKNKSKKGRFPIETKGETDKDALLRVEHLSSKTEDIRILQDVSTLSFSNQVQAILGPTGAGKSSLLSFIAGRKLHADCTGVVLVDREPRSRPWLCKNIAFLEQDEALLPTATVRETLEFAARLRLSTSLSDLQIGEKVAALIDELNLTDRADSYIGGDAFFRGLSGGEKRRVSIGEQFIQEPRILVLDEPTSGLDSETTMLLLRLLKRYVSEEKGRTVIMSVHQPNGEVMTMIDRLCLMANGRVVFDGPTTSAKSFFTSNGFQIPKNFNPTDHYLSVITKRDSATALTQSFTSLRRAAANEEHKSISHTQFPPHATMMAGTQFKESLGPGASWCAQFRCILIRNARQWWRDPVMLFAETLEYVGSGILIGMLFFRLPDTKYSGTLNRTSLFGFLLLILSFVPSFTTITKFDRQRGLLKREPTSGLYTFSAYYAAMTVMSWAVRLSLSFVCGSLACFMPGLRTDVFGRYISVIMVLIHPPLPQIIPQPAQLASARRTVATTQRTIFIETIGRARVLITRSSSHEASATF